MSFRKKCFSKCRKRSETNCGPKICKYVKGKKYQYCRLGSKYKLDEKCNITKKTRKRKMTKKQARLNIYNFLNKTNKTRKNKNNLAANKIQTFMKKNRMKIKSRFLQSICSESGVCLAFGNKSNEIKKFFNNFNNFKYANNTIKRVGEPSANGFVNEVSYVREKYRAHCIIKSSSKLSADNLFYEYLCGLVVNSWCVRFPCFLETYGLYEYVDDYAWEKMKNNQTTSINSLKNYIAFLNSNSINVNGKYFNYLMENSCLNSKHIVIMIQHMKNVGTLYDFLEYSKNKFLAANNQLVTILFQVYFALHVLKDNYTHYDLHYNNVIIYQPNRKGYIHYHYVLSNGDTISFKSPYMAKIIDYGRSYFKHETNDGFNSANIYDKICKEKECSSCGRYDGYKFLSKQNSSYNQHYIHSTVPNKSHDLRLLYIIKNYFEKGKNKYFEKGKEKNTDLLHSNILDKIKYDTKFGTPEMKNNGYPDKIQTVTDAFKGLSDLLLQPDFIKNNEDDTDMMGLGKMCDLYIYENNRPMKFKI